MYFLICECRGRLIIYRKKKVCVCVCVFVDKLITSTIISKFNFHFFLFLLR